MKRVLIWAMSVMLGLISLMLSPDRVEAAAASRNLALNQPTTQSSIALGGEPQRAVDGNTSSQWEDGSITHTNEDPQAWWQVDLGDRYAIDAIRIFNREDCCSGRLHNFYVMVSDDPLPADLDRARDQATWSQSMTHIAGPQETFAVGQSGRYVQVLGDPLSIAQQRLANLCGQTIALLSWKGDYLHRTDAPQEVTTGMTGVGDLWTLECIEDGKIQIKSQKGDYLHRPDFVQGVTTGSTGIGNQWTLIQLSPCADPFIYGRADQ